jgi:uncharacterized membrane protein YphA (DoxX/SURF4 family)
MRRQETYIPYISESGHLMLRLLIASYFIGAATGIVPFSSGREMAAILLPDAYAGFGYSAFMFTTSYLILMGRQIRAAALLLAVFVFWSSFLASFGPNRTLGLEEFWRDLALISGLLLTYANRAPVAGKELVKQKPGTAGAAAITPRRIMPSKKPRTTGATKTGGPSHASYPAFAQSPDEMAALFSKAFDVK